MNLLEIVILHIFMVLFSMPSKPTPGDEIDAKRVETCAVTFRVEDMTYTRELHLEEDAPIVESTVREKVDSDGGMIRLLPAIASSKSEIKESARILSKPPRIIVPR